MSEEILDDPEYWLERALERVQCGRRNAVGTFLATQLRDNRVPKKTAKRTMERYARQVPKCGGDPYTEREALSTMKSVYRTERRDPATVESDGEGTDRLEQRAREREQELLEKFREDPTSLSRKEEKRLRYSPISNGVMLDVERFEMAKEWMTEKEIGVIFHACPAVSRRYKANLSTNKNEICDCDCVEYKRTRSMAFMTVHLSDEDVDALERIKDRIVNRALQRRSQNI